MDRDYIKAIFTKGGKCKFLLFELRNGYARLCQSEERDDLFAMSCTPICTFEITPATQENYAIVKGKIEAVEEWELLGETYDELPIAVA